MEQHLLDQVLALLKFEISGVNELQLALPEEMPEDIFAAKDREFRNKLNDRFVQLKNNGTNFQFRSLKYFKLEYGGLNGKQVIRKLISITNDEELMKDGNCFVFHVKDKPDTALIIFDSLHLIEENAVSPEKAPHKHNWYRAFDDEKCKKKIEKGYLDFDGRVVDQFRSCLPAQYKSFMTLKMREVNMEYRRLFFGIGGEIAKGFSKKLKMHEYLKDFPIPALIALAIDNDMSGKLQAVFTPHDLQFHSRPTRLEETYKEKAKLRKDAAKKIIDHVFEPSSSGRYDEEEIKQKAEELKTFYK